MKEKKKECPSCAMQVGVEEKVCPICAYEFPTRMKGTSWVAIILILAFLLWMIL